MSPLSRRRVFPSNHEFVRRTLKDFRVREDGQEFVARLRGEGRFRSSVFPELFDSDPQVLVEMIPATDWKRPAWWRRWAIALRFPYLSFSLLPLLLVLCASGRAAPGPIGFVTFLLFASVALIHLGCNLWGDYEDHLRGIDSPDASGGSGVVQKLWIPAVHLRNGAAALFLGGCALGLLLLLQLPISILGGPLLWLSLLGAFGAASYSGWPFHYKYFGLGEPIVFFLSGPLITGGAALIYQQSASALWPFALRSLPLAFLVVLRLHSGNMQRVPFDTMAGVFTIARWLGFVWSKHACAFLVLAPFLATAALVALGTAPAAAFAGFLALPFAGQTLRELPATRGPLDPALHDLRRAAARLHLAFGLLYALSYLFY